MFIVDSKWNWWSSVNMMELTVVRFRVPVRVNQEPNISGPQSAAGSEAEVGLLGSSGPPGTNGIH